MELGMETITLEPVFQEFTICGMSITDSEKALTDELSKLLKGAAQ